MRQKLIPNLLFSGLLTFGLGAALQAAPQEAAPAPQDQSPYSAYNSRDLRANQRMLDGVRTDLDQAENNLPRYSDSRDSFDRLRGELSDLQYHWDEYTYQPRQVDDVISALNRALDSPDLLPRDRDRLTEDLNLLRSFRDRHE